MSALSRSVRRKLFGETRTIPLGIAAGILLTFLLQTLLPKGDWQTVGGFAFAAILIATLLRSLRLRTLRRHK